MHMSSDDGVHRPCLEEGHLLSSKRASNMTAHFQDSKVLRHSPIGDYEDLEQQIEGFLNRSPGAQLPIGRKIQEDLPIEYLCNNKGQLNWRSLQLTSSGIDFAKTRICFLV